MKVMHNPNQNIGLEDQKKKKKNQEDWLPWLIIVIYSL